MVELVNISHFCVRVLLSRRNSVYDAIIEKAKDGHHEPREKTSII